MAESLLMHRFAITLCVYRECCQSCCAHWCITNPMQRWLLTACLQPQTISSSWMLAWSGPATALPSWGPPQAQGCTRQGQRKAGVCHAAAATPTAGLAAAAL